MFQISSVSPYALPLLEADEWSRNRLYHETLFPLDFSPSCWGTYGLGDKSDHRYFSSPLLINERSDEFRQSLAELSAALEVEFPESGASAALAQAVELFEPHNVHRLAISYFRKWHPHSPIIHRASFDPNSSSFSLLLTVVLIGALHSNSARDVEMARKMVFVAEEFVYRDPVFVLLQSGDAQTTEVNDNQTLETLQAVFSILHILLCEGSTEKRHFARSVLLSRLVTVRLSNIIPLLTRLTKSTRHYGQRHF